MKRIGLVLCGALAMPLISLSTGCCGACPMTKRAEMKAATCGTACMSCPSTRKAAKAAKGDADCPDGICAAGAAITKPAEAEKPAAGYSEINTAALAMLLNSGANAVVLDARTGQWDDGRRLPGAKALAPDTDEAAALAAIGAKDQLVITYCGNINCPASKHLANRLLELGFSNVMKYPEGIDDWQAHGHKIEQAE